jgi:hypothetical protein
MNTTILLWTGENVFKPRQAPVPSGSNGTVTAQNKLMCVTAQRKIGGNFMLHRADRHRL